MGKPRLCEILDVDIGERFRIDNPSCPDCIFYIDEGGKFMMARNGDWVGSTSLLCYIIEHPDSIMREDRWTEKDKSDAEAVRKLWPEAAIVKCGEGYISIWNARNEDGSCGGIIADFANKDHKLFPSVRKVNKEVSLDEILDAD